MASTLTRTAAALAVASLPLIAGATTAQAGDEDHKRDKGRDYCREDRNDNHKRTDEHKRGSGYDDPKSRMTIARYGEDKKKDWRDDNCQTHHKPPEHKPPRHDPPKHHPKHRDHHKRHHHAKYDPYNEVRTATAKYFSVAAAERDGYRRPASGVLRGCITETAGKASPAMGFHWINAALEDTKVELTKPEALVYEPTKDGKLDLVAVEYVVPKAAWDKAGNLHPPKLFGQEYMLVSLPGIAPFYALHAWVWKFNPDGIHAAFNPIVSCTYAGLQPK
jgi:hypothetical protein